MKDEIRALLRFVAFAFVLTSAFARPVGLGAYVADHFPPEKNASAATFHTPARDALDDNWEFVQFLYDADTTFSNWRAALNAVPVGMGFSHGGRGLLATLHTVFRTTDYGRSWRNLDPHPLPSSQPSAYMVFRSPYFISHLAMRPVQREAAVLDTAIVAVYNADLDTSELRTIYFSAQYELWPFATLPVGHWLTTIVIPDSVRALAIAGLDGRLYRNDTLRLGTAWQYISAEKGFIRSGRSDSLMPEQTWISAGTSAQNLVLAVGSHQWISRDAGQWFHIQVAADNIFDGCVSFYDANLGVTGGGIIAPSHQGWVHRTTDGARTWSARTLDVSVPIRAVKMVSPLIGFAAGGDYQENHGAIYRTIDGGQTWQPDLDVGAEIKLLDAVRVNQAYVDVFAAGVYPDFSGGLWRTRLFLPDNSGAVIFASPDTIDFGLRAPNTRDTLYTWIRNTGTVSDTVVRVSGSNGTFTPVFPYPQGYIMNAGDSVRIAIALRADSVSGSRSQRLVIETRHSGRPEIFCKAQIGLGIGDHAIPIPQTAALQIYPNPGNAQFSIRYELPRAENISLRVYDLSGRLVETLRSENTTAGTHDITWNAARFSSGIYFVRLDGLGIGVTQKLLLIK